MFVQELIKLSVQRTGRQTLVFQHRPVLLTTAAVGGKKELEGPLHPWFDHLNPDTKFGQPSWEKAETQMQSLAVQTALEKAHLQPKDIDILFGGDLLNQCIGTSFCLRDLSIPFLGLYGACSTMAESLLLGSMAISGSFAQRVIAMTSSHFASAERQYRFPLVYGGQRPPTAQWTVTGSGCAILGREGSGPRITAATIGRVVDWGIKDANNMGAAMAPAAYDTLSQHFADLNIGPTAYDLIVTGDLGQLGWQIVSDLFAKDGVSMDGVYQDCGMMIYDQKAQDVHAGGSGCGCSAVVLCGYLYRQMLERRYRKILFCGTGALLSPTSTQQKESTPGICHAVAIELED